MGVLNPNVYSTLLRDRDEEIQDVVTKHAAAYWVSFAEVLAALAMGVLVAIVPATLSMVPFTIAGLLLLHAGWRALVVRRDVLVITNLRVFRISGVVNQRRAGMPLARIVDITVDKPVLGRILGYGHLTFENAAQEQGLREIHFVPDPDDREQTIQDLVSARY
ncbi:MAG: PH domain-containing protein [Nocardioides sp.]|jgi:uncharacterized membrane protein YdbT with pleckstrin-like domain